MVVVATVAVVGVVVADVTNDVSAVAAADIGAGAVVVVAATADVSTAANTSTNAKYANACMNVQRC